MGRYTRGSNYRPFLYRRKFNERTHLNLLQAQIVPAINDVVKKNSGEFTQDIVFQQDGALPHYTARV